MSAAPNHPIRVARDKSASGTNMWTVVVSDEERAWFTGAGAKLRALDFALRRAEDLRSFGRVRIVVEEQKLRLAGARGHAGRG